jgi:hypothetical protein
MIPAPMKGVAMKIRYDGPCDFVNVAPLKPYGRHDKGVIKDYPDKFGAELLETSKKHMWSVVEGPKGGKVEPEPEAAQDDEPKAEASDAPVAEEPALPEEKAAETPEEGPKAEPPATSLAEPAQPATRPKGKGKKAKK